MERFVEFLIGGALMLLIVGGFVGFIVGLFVLGEWLFPYQPWATILFVFGVALFLLGGFGFAFREGRDK